MLNYEELFSTEKRIFLLSKIIYKKDKFSFTDILNLSKLSKGFVSKYLEILKNEKIIGEKNNKYFLKSNVKVQSIKIFLNLNSIKLKKVEKKFNNIKSIGLYGSCVKGQNNEDSDIDIWVLVDNLNQNKMFEISNYLKNCNDKFSILFLDNFKLKRIQEENQLFYHSLVFNSVVLHGSELENEQI